MEKAEWRRKPAVEKGPQKAQKGTKMVFPADVVLFGGCDRGGAGIQ
jgi:hypothetical protein